MKPSVVVCMFKVDADSEPLSTSTSRQYVCSRLLPALPTSSTRIELAAVVGSTEYGAEVLPDRTCLTRLRAEA